MHFFNFAEHTIYILHAIIKLTGTIFMNKKKGKNKRSFHLP